MDERETLKQAIASLHLAKTTEEKERSFIQIANAWDPLYSKKEDVSEIIKGTNLIQDIADALEANIEKWGPRFPLWMNYLMSSAKYYGDFYSKDELLSLKNAFTNYVMRGYWGCLQACGHAASMKEVNQLLLHDDAFFNILKGAGLQATSLPKFVICITDGIEEWQQRIISDKQFVLDLLAHPNQHDVWIAFENLAQHPDAKMLIPHEVLAMAIKEKKVTVCALLCNDDDLSKIELGDEWISETVGMLECLLQKGFVYYRGSYPKNLLDLVLPVSNLSVVDSYKEVLGGKCVLLLQKLVTERVIDSQDIKPYLTRGKQEASKALWNFAYHEANRNLIINADGIKILAATLAQTDDPIIKKNIAGILYMLDSHHQSVTKPSVPAKGHVMISYNWASQSTVKRLAASLKAQGYNVWLDIEKMGGSTLEAMALAIEQSDLVLMCMTQKYKDSPNCRLEGEYCINRRVPFVPLMMQQGYRPDGWLGIALGAKLYYDFCDEMAWDQKMSELVKVIGDHGKASSQIVVPSHPIVHPTSPTVSQKLVTDWTDEDIHVWMTSEKILRYFELFKEHQFNGQALLELKFYIATNAKVYFQMCKDIGISAYGDMLKLSAALRKLQ